MMSTTHRSLSPDTRTGGRVVAVALVGILAVGALAGCFGASSSDEQLVVASPSGWIGEEIRTHMIVKILRDELGYDVKHLENLQAGPIYTALSDGDVHVFAGAWLPLQNDSLNAQPAGTIKILADNLPAESVGLSLAVPKYVADMGITSLADLDANKDLFGGKIMGIEPGAGMMQVGKARTALDIYGLADWEIIDASTPAMLAAYGDAVEAREPIVIMMWTPHYAYSKWSGDEAVTDLEDPGYEIDGQTMYLYKDQSDVARVQTLVHKDFEATFPEAAAFLKRFQITVEEENELMLQVANGKSAKDAAYDYLAANPGKIQAWLGK